MGAHGEAELERLAPGLTKAIDWTPGPDVPGAYRVGHSKPNGHPADGMTAQVCIGGGAFSSIPNPQSYENGGIVWTSTWGNYAAVRYAAASLIQSYDYLLCGDITMKEATERLRLLRNARRELCRAHFHEQSAIAKATSLRPVGDA